MHVIRFPHSRCIVSVCIPTPGHRIAMNNPCTLKPVLESNQDVAAKLREAANLLALQGADPFRVDAYRHAADTVARLRRDIGQLTEVEGPEGLISLPHIGRGIAAAIAEIVATGRWVRLDRLRGELPPQSEAQLPAAAGDHPTCGHASVPRAGYTEPSSSSTQQTASPSGLSR